MKKIYFFLMTLMVALCANAETLYLRGAFNGWGYSEATTFKTTDNVTYTLDNVTLGKGVEFAIANADWSTKYCGATNIPLNTMTELWAGANSTLAEDFTGTIQFVPNLKKVIFIVKQIQTEITWQLFGPLVNDWEGFDLTENNGSWEKKNFQVKAGNFGVRELTNGSQTHWYWMAKDGGNATIVSATGVYQFGEEKTMTEGTNPYIMAGTYNFSWDPTTKKLTVTNLSGSSEPAPEPFTVYFYNDKDWETPYIHYWGGISDSSWPGVAMTKVAGTQNVWKYTVAAGTTKCLFNAGDGDPSKTSDFDAVADDIYGTTGSLGAYADFTEPGSEPALEEAAWIYWDNTAAQWATPTIYYWGASEPTWPGVAMTRVPDTMTWKYEVPAGTTGILFNAGDGDASKTADFVPVEGHIYTQAGDKGLEADYVAPTAYSVSFRNADNWANVNAYAWLEGTGEALGSWPGTPMTYSEKSGLYELTFFSYFEPNLIVFNAGTDGAKTGDLVFDDGKTYSVNKDYTINFDNTNSAWAEVYAYVTAGADELNGEFPGAKMTKGEGQVWNYTLTTDNLPTTVVFSNGGEKALAADAFVADKTYSAPAKALAYALYDVEDGIFGDWDGTVTDNCATIFVEGFGEYGDHKFFVAAYDVETADEAMEEYAAAELANDEEAMEAAYNKYFSSFTYYSAKAELVNGEWTTEEQVEADEENAMTLPANAIGRDVTFIFAVDSHSVCASWTVPYQIYVVGAFTDWKTVEAYSASSDSATDNCVEVSVYNYHNAVEGVEGDGFKVIINGEWYGAEEANVTLTWAEGNGNWYQMTEGGNNMLISNDYEGKCVDFTIALDAKTIKLTNSSATGVDSIEAENNGVAEYFNLQGVRVQNPENGLYIVRKAGKVSKVMVR